MSAGPQTERDEEPPMSIRTRKFVGTIALLLLVMVWGLLAMALAQSVLTDINGFVAAIYYIVAGLGWVLPAMPLISWMARPDRA
jgi:NhaP-type Na+/H+ or K+/H+ antiporter